MVPPVFFSDGKAASTGDLMAAAADIEADLALHLLDEGGATALDRGKKSHAARTLERPSPSAPAFVWEGTALRMGFIDWDHEEAMLGFGPEVGGGNPVVESGGEEGCRSVRCSGSATPARGRSMRKTFPSCCQSLVLYLMSALKSRHSNQMIRSCSGSRTK